MDERIENDGDLTRDERRQLIEKLSTVWELAPPDVARENSVTWYRENAAPLRRHECRHNLAEVKYNIVGWVLSPRYAVTIEICKARID